MAKRAALPTILFAVGAFIVLFIAVWLIMSFVERFVTGTGTLKNQLSTIYLIIFCCFII